VSKNQHKKFQRDAGRKAIRVVEWVFLRMHYGMVKFLTPVVCAIAWMFLRRHRRVAAESQAVAYGEEMSAKERGALVRRNFFNLGHCAIDMVYFSYHGKMLPEKVRFSGLKHIDEALKKKKGVIALTAHFGSFPLMLRRFAAEGYKVNIVLRNMRDAKLDEHLVNWMRNMHIRPIFAQPRLKCVNSVLRALRNNELVFILLDQNFGGDGRIFVDFFGTPAATAAGPFVFSQRSGAPVIPVFNRRVKDDLYEIMVEPPMTLEQGGTSEETLFFNVEKATKLIEGYIRRYPWEWGWMHRRWKTRPENEVTNKEG